MIKTEHIIVIVIIIIVIGLIYKDMSKQNEHMQTNMEYPVTLENITTNINNIIYAINTTLDDASQTTEFIKKLNDQYEIINSNYNNIIKEYNAKNKINIPTYKTNIINAQKKLYTLYDNSDYLSLSRNIQSVNNFLYKLKQEQIKKIDDVYEKLNKLSDNIDNIFGNIKQKYTEGTIGYASDQYFMNHRFIEKIKTNVDKIISDGINKNNYKIKPIVPPTLYTFTFTKPNTKFNNIEPIKLI